jgi:protein tyrosine/serine phosphatase
MSVIKAVPEFSAARMRLWLKRSSRILAVVTICVLAWVGYLRLSGNFHAVEDGLVYRSGQLSKAQFADRISERGIRTIINLRGNNTGRPWYDDEVAASTTAHVVHVDFPLSSGRELTDDQLIKLTTLLRDADRPLLIHCEAGADRTGLVSALYELVVAKRPAEEASAQLSIRYGHFPWLRNSTVAMDRSFTRAVTLMRATALESPSTK